MEEEKKKNANPRALATKSLIHSALLSLLQEKKISKISICELCHLAGINRTTFYNHYGSQYEVLQEIAQEFLQSTSLAVMSHLTTGDNVQDCIVQALYYIKEHLDFAKLILDQEHYDLLSHLSISLPTFDQMVRKNLPSSLTEQEMKALTSFVQYGSVQLLKEWILADCPTSPEEETALLFWVVARTTSSNVSQETL